MPPVCASPSSMSGAGITGWPGKWSAKWSSASDRFLTVVADLPDSNATKRSIQIQRMDTPEDRRQRTEDRGRPDRHNPLSSVFCPLIRSGSRPRAGRELALDVADDQV